MRKVAIFVEGRTEQEFVKALLVALFGVKGFHLQIKSQHMGRLTLVSDEPQAEAQTFIMLINCNTDSQVKTQIRDQFPTLLTADYSAVIGLQDVFPFTHADIPKVQAGLSARLPANPNLPIYMHLSILETEAWFLDELSHFPRIDPALTISNIVAAGFDVENIFGEAWAHPADTLGQIYNLAGKGYRKSTAHIQRTVAALSQDELYINVRARSPSFSQFLASLERVFFPPLLTHSH